MPSISVSIKHAGRVHPLTLDTALPPSAFKQSIFEVTGVPVERMKVMVKGGVLKDDADWAKVGVKEGQTLMVIGAAGPLPKAPEKPIVFLEDMDDAELASALALPVGLINLGNTCYMNATVQALRAIPELQVALAPSTAVVAPTLPPLPGALRDLYTSMSRTTEGIVPGRFLTVLRQAVPQFGEVDRTRASRVGMMGAYAQQDAEECWTAITNALKEVPGLPLPEMEVAQNQVQAEGLAEEQRPFVDQFLMGEVRRELSCDEAPEEPATVRTEKVLKIECNITNATNYMHSGILAGLDQQVEKNSPSLGREAVYTQRSRFSRLPSYLTIHMVRFAWRADINKKAKIMRKVKFPLEFDALDLVTDDLRKQLEPVGRKLSEVERERAERRKVRKRTKAAPALAAAAAEAAKGKEREADVEMADAAGPEAGASTAAAGEEETEVKGKAVLGAVLEDESVYRQRELKELEALIDPNLKKDVGCSVSGQYELVAIVTHKGAAADAGHYMGFVKKSVFHPAVIGEAGASSSVATPLVLDEDDEDWYKFDDEKVSIFPKEKLATLDGGGEDSSAYVLLYRSRSLA